MDVDSGGIPALKLVIAVDGMTTTTYVDMDRIDLDDPQGVDEMVDQIREIKLEGRALRRWWATAVEAGNA
jgi:hypothetical protein